MSGRILLIKVWIQNCNKRTIRFDFLRAEHFYKVIVTHTAHAKKKKKRTPEEFFTCLHNICPINPYVKIAYLLLILHGSNTRLPLEGAGISELLAYHYCTAEFGYCPLGVKAAVMKDTVLNESLRTVTLIMTKRWTALYCAQRFEQYSFLTNELWKPYTVHLYFDFQLHFDWQMLSGLKRKTAVCCEL